MDNEEVLMTIPVSGIPNGYKAVAVRPARPGEIVVNPGANEGISTTPSFWTSSTYSDYPMIILEKTYDPGIGIQNGWKVWKDYRGKWGAAEKTSLEWKIQGLEYFPDFVPPPDGCSAIVERP
jgi:hypothetical protein